jgi:UDP-N-acetylglucosamine--N-acetylmuramyl-(pentapeptide) pyrophosphoryl-undecaprenol N-acetylglucosamine transferase
VYPALAVLQALRRRKPDSTVLWVGGERGMETELVQRAGIPFQTIPAAGVHGVGLRALPGNLLRLGRGFWAARRILQDFRPHALFFTGGYVAVPMALAGRFAARPRPASVLYVPDIEPGLALKTLGRFADRIAVTAEASRPYFSRPERISVSGYPTRPELSAWQPEQARHALGLSSALPVLLVFGGSKGARSINRALVAILPQLLPEMQVVHISGALDWPEVEAAQQTLAPALAGRYRAFAYLHEEMGAALSAADLVVARAGASALGEFPLFGLPAILAPYPYAWRYQKVNADHLAAHGAAITIADESLGTHLLSAIQALMRNPQRRDAMRQAMRGLARPQAAESIVELLIQSAAAAAGQGV